MLRKKNVNYTYSRRSVTGAFQVQCQDNINCPFLEAPYGARVLYQHPNQASEVSKEWVPADSGLLGSLPQHLGKTIKVIHTQLPFNLSVSPSHQGTGMSYCRSKKCQGYVFG